MSQEQSAAEHRSRPQGENFAAFMAQGWAPSEDVLPQISEAAQYAAARREQVSAAFPSERLVVPAGGLKIRSNDTDYLFRPHSAFAHLTGLGADREPDAVLLLDPLADGGHEAIIFVQPPAGRDSTDFFADSRMGEYWIGHRPSMEAMTAELGMSARHLSELSDAVAKDVPGVQVRVIADADRDVTELVRAARAQGTVESATSEQESTSEQEAVEGDLEFARTLSSLRLVKDEWEIAQMEVAVAATATAFDAVVAELPQALARGRGERWIEGVFGLHARHEGNGVGYDSICAAGDHATTLHWIRNTGDIAEDELLLLDAGVETDALYTADVTRTLPASGTFSDVQRRVYDVVLAAADAGLAAAKPGNRFSDIHAAAIRVIATTLHEWGLLPEGVSVEDTLDADEGQFHRRWMVHGTSHHLGIDVHDCALALRADYMDAELLPGMVLTVEPGLYFKTEDQLVPAELRGIGVRIEDDIVIIEDGCRNLSQMLPRRADEVEQWVANAGRRDVR